jgi:3-oxoacyl-[acyl-carrier protein] reductase
MRLKDRVAVVTGGGSGIGRAICLLFSEEGADLVIPDINFEAAQEVAREVESRGRKALPSNTDISEDDQVADLFNRALSQFGKIDILVNNAGMGILQPFLETTRESWDKHLKVHLTGTFICSQLAAKDMVKRRYGKIINIVSIAGIVGSVGRAAYGAAKGGMITLTKVMAMELAEYGINVNAIAPGPILTPLLEKALPEEDKKEYTRSVPLGRFGKPEEVAKTTVFLASEESSYITGQILGVEGGFLSRGIMKR